MLRSVTRLRPRRPTPESNASSTARSLGFHNPTVSDRIGEPTGYTACVGGAERGVEGGLVLEVAPLHEEDRGAQPRLSVARVVSI